MIVFAFAAALAATPLQGGDKTRSILVDVCLPFVTGETSDTVALEFLGFVETPAPSDDSRTYRTDDDAHLLRLTSQGSEEDDSLYRVCVIQPRRGGLDAARSAVQPVMRQQGFVADPAQPASRPIWTKGGITVSVRQNPGAAAVVRVTYSSLDAAGG